MSKVFKFKSSKKTRGYDIKTLLNKKEEKGKIGIEIEVEGNKFKKTEIPSPWKYVKDGSLRGEDNAEYVLRSPIEFNKVPDAIATLWKMFTDYGSVLDDSNRTSIHVHLNAQHFHLNRLCSFFALYFSIEELLTEWCGEHRVGNLFCLRAKDAPAIVSHLKDFIQKEGNVHTSENLHYGGLNAHSLIKFGSIEIRSLRGVSDPQMILDWVSILERIYNLSDEFKDPRVLCENFSGNGPLEYMQMILGDKTNLIRDSIQWDMQRIKESLYDGIRLAQDLCYCREWSEYKPVILEKDPFNRTPKAVIESINNSTAGATTAALSNYFATTVEQFTPTVFEVDLPEWMDDSESDYVDTDDDF